jgi:hypothetical protein
MIGMAFGIGFVIAPAIGGFLGEIDTRLPFKAAVVLCLTNFVYGLFVLPESLPPERRTPRFDWAHANPLGALKLLRRYPQVLGLISVLFLLAFAHMVYPSTFVLYADYRFGWGPQMVGYTLAGVGVLAAIVQGGLIKKIVSVFGERRTLLLGLGCGTLGFALYGLAPSGPWFWAAPFEVGHEFGGRGLPPSFTPDMLKARLKGGPEAKAAENTTLVVVVTDAVLTKPQARRLAMIAQTGMARAIYPVHAPTDGDVVFAAATGEKPIDPRFGLTELGMVAANVLARAIARGVYSATALPFPGALPAWKDRFG